MKPVLFANESKIADGTGTASHAFCVANSPSCIGQNLFCAAEHIAASAAASAC